MWRQRIWRQLGVELDHRHWREGTLQVLLGVALTLGLPVYGISVYYAWIHGLNGIIVADSTVLATLFAVWWFDGLPHRLRAHLVVIAIYTLGSVLLGVAGTVAQIYLVGQAAVATTLVGLRTGLAFVVLNTLTVLCLGLAGLVLWESEPAGLANDVQAWVLVASNYLLVSGVVTLMVGAILQTLESALDREVTARAALHERNEHLETLIDTSPQGIALLDLDARLLEVSRASVELLQAASADDLIGRSFLDFVAESDRPRFLGHLELVRDGNGGEIECTLSGLEGEPICVGLVSAPIHRDGLQRRHLMILRDLTQRREMEKTLLEAQRLDAIGKLTGGIAHDFNNLLTVVLIGADDLHADLADRPALQQLAGTVRGAAERGAELTQRLLSFARRQTLDPRPVHIGSLLEGMLPLLTRTLGDDMEVELAGAQDPACVANVDAHQLENAVLNLGINARDAMRRGGRLMLEVECVDLEDVVLGGRGSIAPGRYVALSVSDSGAGMSPETQARAFEPFFTTKGVGEGTGLGLSMVYGFVRQSQGEARIYSELGHGTTVRLYLPASSAGSSGEPASVPPATDGGGNEHILVVEDDPIVRDQVVRQLRDSGYRVTAADNGVVALELLRADEAFDLLFTDVVMPGGIHGKDLAVSARALWPDLPVLLTSGYSEGALARWGGRTLPTGVVVLSKPYRRVELLSRLRRLLGSSHDA